MTDIIKKIVSICPAIGDWYAVYIPHESEKDRTPIYSRVACWCVVVWTDKEGDVYNVDAIDDGHDCTSLAGEADNFSHFQHGKDSQNHV